MNGLLTLSPLYASLAMAHIERPEHIDAAQVDTQDAAPDTVDHAADPNSLTFKINELFGKNNTQ
jgi:hypothetical protein